MSTPGIRHCCPLLMPAQLGALLHQHSTGLWRSHTCFLLLVFLSTTALQGQPVLGLLTFQALVLQASTCCPVAPCLQDLVRVGTVFSPVMHCLGLLCAVQSVKWAEDVADINENSGKRKSKSEPMHARQHVQECAAVLTQGAPLSAQLSVWPQFCPSLLLQAAARVCWTGW